MATISLDELAELRRAIQDANPLPVTKSVLNAGLQAVEDAWENTVRAELVAAAKAAMVVAGYAGCTNNQAKQVMKFWLRYKFGKGG